MNLTFGPVVTCEHGGNLVPKRYSRCFHSAQKALRSHRGYDPGALELAREIADSLDSECFFSTTTRLLVDLNRSVGHPALHSEFVSQLSTDQRNAILQAYYVPYRQRVIDTVQSTIASGQVACHLSIHTFTPKLAGVVRQADVAVLYDPRHPREKQLACDWLDGIDDEFSGLKLRRNYPYRGTHIATTSAWNSKSTSDSPSRPAHRGSRFAGPSRSPSVDSPDRDFPIFTS